jgi:hypothetical protein
MSGGGRSDKGNCYIKSAQICCVAISSIRICLMASIFLPHCHLLAIRTDNSQEYQKHREERRDNRPRFSLSFLKNHPGLWAVMYLCYGLWDGFSEMRG